MNATKKRGPKPTADSLNKPLPVRLAETDLRRLALLRKRMRLGSNSETMRALLREAAERHGIS